MPLSTRLKRKSAICLHLPFGRLGPVVDGANLNTPAQRRVVTGGYALVDDVAVVTPGLSTRRKRSSAICIHLPFGRVGPLPDGDNLQSPDQRRHAAMGYAFSDSVAPITEYVVAGLCAAQDAASSGTVVRAPRVQRALPYIAVRTRSIQWDHLVRMAEGPEFRVKQPYPVYTFGGGQVRRNFTENT